MSPDPAIKLFGQTIPFPLHDGITTAVAVDGDGWDDLEASSPQEKRPKEAQGEEQEKKAESNVETTETKEREQTDPISMSEESAEPATTSVTNSSPQTPSVEKENANTNAPKHDEGENEASISKEKAMKKPDKILHCPRCNSLETKFCYYNNYNVNQPRHFCKNCQRYWTAGGTMRNVPVGAGRRKTKTSSLNYRHISVSEALQAAQNGIPEATHQPPLKPNGTVLSFGSDVPLCESMTSVLNIAEKTPTNCRRSGFHHHTEEQKFPNSCEGCENGEEHSSGSSVTTSNSAEGNQANLQEHAQHNCQPFPPQLPCFPGAPWSYPWNSTQWGSPVAPAAFCASSFPVSFYPTPAYWNCITGTWTVPWLSPPPPSNAGSSGSCTNSPTLGKHSRDGNMLKQSNSVKQETVKQNNSERCLWIPKTLRIDDPEEAAKSSIWTTLGIRNEKTDTVTGGRLFKGFQSKVDDRKHMTERSPVLHANPAALSRSLKFHESSQVGTDQSERHDRKHMTERSPVLHANPAALSRSLKFHESSQVGTDQSERHDMLI